MFARLPFQPGHALVDAGIGIGLVVMNHETDFALGVDDHLHAQGGFPALKTTSMAVMRS